MYDVGYCKFVHHNLNGKPTFVGVILCTNDSKAALLYWAVRVNDWILFIFLGQLVSEEIQNGESRCHTGIV